jgi:hypothetical protein
MDQSRELQILLPAWDGTAVQKGTSLLSFLKLSGRKQETFFLPAERSRQAPARKNARKPLWTICFVSFLSCVHPKTDRAPKIDEIPKRSWPRRPTWSKSCMSYDKLSV